MSFVSPVKGKLFGEDRKAYIYGVSRRESSSDLTLSDLVDPNITSRKVHNSKTAGYGFIGYFQFGESALYDLGYFKPPFEFSNIPSSSFQKSLMVNDWNGNWTGLDSVTSKSIFLKDRTIQIKAFNKWINILCGRLNSQNLNEFYGLRINGIEITESGCIAGAHLKGPKYVLEFVQGLGNSADDFGTKVGEYISLFAHYDLESCCNRKIYINVIDNDSNPILGKKVIVESEYKEGKYYNKIGKISNDYKTNNEGKIPVIVRHPGTKIKIIVDDQIYEFTQQKNKIESYTIKLSKEISVPAKLEIDSTPQPKPQPTKTSQEVRNEQNSAEAQNDTVNQTATDVNFNIQIVEEDTGKAISNMAFYLTYKENMKGHVADAAGLKQGIVAEVGQDIEVSITGEGKFQKIHHFKVEKKLNNQTLKVKLPVCCFKINVKHNNQNVTNTLVSIFYRNKQIVKRTDGSGNVDVKMLTGFVYGFGIKNKELKKVRVIQGLSTRYFTVNEGFVKASKLYEIVDKQNQKQADEIKRKQQQEQEKKAKEQAEKAKSEAEKNQPKQNNTHTENGGKPLTTVSTQAPATSDTTNYIIYPNGTIDRINKSASGFAAYYYVINNKPILIGKSRIYTADRWSKKGKKTSGISYLVSIREIFGDLSSTPMKKWEKSIGTLNISIANDSLEQHRYWLSTVSFAAYIGAVCRFGEKVRFSGFSDRNGSPGKSNSHLNGEVGDIGYIRVDRNNAVGVNFEMAQYDHEASLEFVDILISFGWGEAKKYAK